MPNTVRLKDFAKTATTLASDDYIYAGGQANGTRKILGSNLANYVASEEGGSTLASLSGGKVPTAQLPWTSETFLGTSTVASLPAPGGLNAGDYYITTDSGTNHSVTFAAGDKAISDGTSYSAISDGVRPIGEGGTGASTEEGARTNLEVDSSDEVAETITNGQPSLRFLTNDYVGLGTDSALNFNNTTDDLPFTVSFWAYQDDWTSTTSQAIVDRAGAGGWFIAKETDGDLTFSTSDGTDTIRRRTSSNLTRFNGRWVHIAYSIPGSGPNSDDAFNVALDNMAFYVNAESQNLDATTGPANDYGGRISSASEQLNLGGFAGSNTFLGEIKGFQIFQSALSAADVETIYRSGVPFELSQAQAGDSVTDGSFENWDSASDLTNWGEGSGGSSTVNRESTIVDSGTYAVRFDLDSSASYASISQSGILTAGKLYNVTVRARGDGSAVGLQFGTSASGAAYHNTGYVFTTSYATYSFTITAIDDTFAIGRQAGSAASSSIYLDNVSVREAGAILDINAADATISGSNINLPDRSPNGFSGTSSGMSLAANAVNLPAAVSANHPNPSSGEKILSLGNAGTEKIGGTAEGHMVVSSVAAGVGSELTIASGVVTASAGYHEIDTEGNAASDDLDTITASSWMGAGTRLVVMAIDDSHTVVLKDGTGNLRLAGDFSMDTNVDTMELIYDGTNWCELSRSNNS